MTRKPRIRGGTKHPSEPYPLGEIPRKTTIMVGKQIVHRLAVGQTNITGDDFAEIFAKAINGEHRSSPLGIIDVVWNNCAWSVKTVQNPNPFKATALRFISGRNSPDYSLGISDPHKDIQATGRAVLSIWNSRINEALKKHEDLRIVALVRNMATREFVLFEDEATRFVPDNYRWKKNNRNNFEGYEITTDKRKFTWQPHGSQFTIHHTVPAAACKFSIARNVRIIEFKHVLQLVNYQDNWIEFQQ